MIFFHGTVEENIKKIKKNGILALTVDQWIMEITNKKVCCISNQPTSGEGGNASYFAYGNTKIKNQDGYLVVLELKTDAFAKKVVTIFDNKVLDDYARYHFFIREEFRNIGFDLYQAITEYRNKDRYFKKLDDFLSIEDATVFYEQDQKSYYRKLYEERKNYKLLDITFTDEFYDFIQVIGKWEPFYDFLQIHFSQVTSERYDEFHKDTPFDNNLYWKKFYSWFPQTITEDKYSYFEFWFSSDWLEKRQTTEITKNCQILTKNIEPEYIKGFIKITTPSGFADRFRSCRSKSVFAKEVWKEVHKKMMD